MNCTLRFQEMALKARKEQESLLHEQLHSNIHLLTLVYPQSEECRRVFHKDMFVKNNKAAFQHITHYLLAVLDPETVKTRLPWPLLDAKHEALFRNEVLGYVNELNSVYEYAQIPMLMTSHLVSPGGYRIAKFILKLSQLALSVHLQRDPDIRLTFLFPVRPSKSSESTSSCIERLKRKTKQINVKLLSLEGDYGEYVRSARSESERIKNERGTVKERLKNLKSVHDVCTSIPVSAEVYDSAQTHLRDSLAYSSFVLLKCVKVKELMSFLFGDEIILKFSGNIAELPDETLRFVTDGTRINILSFFEHLNTVLSEIRLKKPNFSSFYVDSELSRTAQISTWLLMICKAYGELIDRSLIISSVIKNSVVNHSFVSNRDDLDSEEVLAVPLETTPT